MGKTRNQIREDTKPYRKAILHMKSIFEQLGGTYHEENGYLIPDLRLPAEEEQPIELWGQQHLDYLKQYHKVTYTNLLTSGKLNSYLADIDRQTKAAERNLCCFFFTVFIQ